MKRFDENEISRIRPLICKENYCFELRKYYVRRMFTELVMCRMFAELVMCRMYAELVGEGGNMK